MTRHTSWSAMMFAAALILANGCQRNQSFVPVTGTVTKNGLPQAGIEVVFLADPESGTVGPRAAGITDESGRYRLQTERGEKGAVRGMHRILAFDINLAHARFIRKQREPTNAQLQASPELAKRFEEESKKAAEATQRIPESFGRINDTPLRAKVGAEPLVFDIEIP